MTNLTKFQLLGPPKPLILNRNEWVLSDLGNGDSNRLKARCTFLVATKIANNCLLHPRSLASIWRDPSLQLSLLTVSCRYGASRARGLSWPQQSCYNTFTTLANFQQQKSKELDHQSSGHSRPNNYWTIEITPVWPLLRYFTIPLWFLYYLINLLYMNGKLKYSRDKSLLQKQQKPQN